MHAVLLLAALFSSQYCPPGKVCPTRPAQQQFVRPAQPALPSPQAPTAATSGNIHLIKHNGVEFYVRGTMGANGVVEVDWTDKANLKAYWNALADAGKTTEDTAPAGAIGDLTTGMALTDSSAKFGVDVGKVGHAKRPMYTANSDKAFNYAEQITESEKPGLHVTVIGTDEARRPVMEDLKSNPALAAVTRDAQVQDYDQKSWAIDPSLGFPADGNPAIIAQTSKSPGDPKGGKVVYTNKTYPGPSKLAEDLRRADPSYKPTPLGADTELPFGLTPNQIGAAVVGGLCALIPSKRKGS